jgi:hypothetical protein
VADLVRRLVDLADPAVDRLDVEAVEIHRRPVVLAICPDVQRRHRKSSFSGFANVAEFRSVWLIGLPGG